MNAPTRTAVYPVLLGWALASAPACDSDARRIVVEEDASSTAGSSAGSDNTSGAGGAANGGAANGGASTGGSNIVGTGDRDASAAGGSALDAGMGGNADPDANPPAAGAGGSESEPPPTYCEGVSPSAGVAAEDHECLDFETPVPGDWTPSVTGAASAAVSEERAFSAPTSWRSAVPAAGDVASESEAVLSWSNVGAQGVARVSISMQVNPTNLGGITPAWSGSIALACVEFGSGEFCLRYSRGGGPSNLYVEYLYTGGPAFLGSCESSQDLSFQLWNELELNVGSNGSLSLLVNGTSALGTCSTSFLADTTANVRLGLASDAVASQAWSVFYDDVVVEIGRQ